ncbi:MAG: AAA family ATPase, partial [Chloroflexi bacterium]|nr:AAA family ATPase [Chloroflexota bacterium]
LMTVIDATNLTTVARRPLLALAERYGRPAVAVVLDLPLDVLRERNAARGRVVGEDVLHRHAAQLRTSLEQLPAEGYVAVIDGTVTGPVVVTER